MKSMKSITRSIAKVAGLAMLAGLMFVPSANAADSQFSVRFGAGVPVQQRVYPGQPNRFYGNYQPRRIWQRGQWSWYRGRRVWVPGHWVFIGNGGSGGYGSYGGYRQNYRGGGNSFQLYGRFGR